MRFVPVKSAEQQAAGLNFRLRALLLRQRAQVANALRSQLAEFGVIVPHSGFKSVIATAARVMTSTDGPIPARAHLALEHYIAQIDATSHRIAELERRILAEVEESESARRLMTIPGVGPMVAMAVTSFAPPAEVFMSARHFSSWIGLTPRNYSSGGSQVLGAVSKMGNKQLRQLLVLGAMAVLKNIKPGDTTALWLARLKQRRPFRVAAVALANKTARIIWALLTRGGTFRRLVSSDTYQPSVA